MAKPRHPGTPRQSKPCNENSAARSKQRSRDLQPALVRRRLLDWYRSHARVLPWRGTKSAYRVWVSEVMLQQTQIRTVIPRYRRFVRAFPTVKALAAAPLERVLEAWSGLGYYRRARCLHQAAQIVEAEFKGKFPRDLRQLKLLPGVGDYTARAVLSIAFGQPHAALDGNIARVMARMLALRGNLGRRDFRTAIELELARLISRRRPGDFNQALMEIGQTICLPRGPRCEACPFQRWCAGRKLGEPEQFPEPRRRRTQEEHFLALAAVRHGPQVFMVRGLDGGLLSDLWNFPAAFGATEMEARERLAARLHELAATKPSLTRLGLFRHSITYRSIHGTVYSATVKRRLQSAAGRWLNLANLDSSAISQLSRKAARIMDAARSVRFAADNL